MRSAKPLRRWACGVLLLCSGSALHAISEKERLRNDSVTAVEYSLEPGETLAMDAFRPAVTVYLSEGTLVHATGPFDVETIKTARGQTIFSPPQTETIRNSGSTAVQFVRIEFHGAGTGQIWGGSGLPASCKLLLENIYARVYEIRLPAGGAEPQHSHRDRVAVCLEGATLKHTLPGGREETAVLRTGEITWRGATTHSAENTGGSALWVIAIEPK